MVIPVILIISLVASSGAVIPKFSSPYSAASESQIRFANENDNTGPGAKQLETAYNTYKTLEEALISYLNDPDTKLPESEREKALAAFQIPVQEHAPIRQFPKTVEEYTGYKPTEGPINEFYIPKQQSYVYGPPNLDLNSHEFDNIQNRNLNPIGEGFGIHKSQVLKRKPISLAHYSKDLKESYNQFNPNPNYSFSYGVHDKTTGDSKSAHETRTDDVVKGFYTFMEADGKQRTVQYTADDNRGFRAVVQRSVPNK